MTGGAGEVGEPLVSIGIPTFERAATLLRALDSALAQTHTRLEVLVYDNGSGDGTEALGVAAAARDPRVRYVRHARNRGPTANFNALFAACRGDYVMMLADDDWLDPEYVAACLKELRQDPGAALVAGRARYSDADGFARDGAMHEHDEADPARRVRAYLRVVDDNGVFYGLMPHAVLDGARPLPNVLGNDWLHMARIASQGRIGTLTTVRIHRDLGGTSADVGSILATFGRSGWQARVPQLVMGWELARDIGWSHPVYARLGRARRLRLALTAAAASVRWRALAWHLVTPSVAGVARRPRGRHLYRLYDVVTRAMGAGRGP